MLPRSLRIRNIGPYKDISIDLASIPGGLVAITGLNGQGKTMFMESMYAGLYREFPTRPEGLYKYCTDRNAGIEFEFEMASKVYRSIINIDSKNRKMEAVLANEGLPLNDGKTSTFDVEIERILGGKDQVLASSYGAQDKRGNFTELAKSKRKDLFIQMIGLQLLQSISDWSNKTGLSLEPEKTNLSGQIEILKTTSEKELPDIEAIRANLDAKKLEYSAMQETLDDLSKHIVLEGAKYDRLPEIRTSYSEKFSKIDILNKAIVPLREKLIAAEESLALDHQSRIDLDIVRKSLVDNREKIILLRQKTETLPALKLKAESLFGSYSKHAADCNRITLQINAQSVLAESLPKLKEKSKELSKVKSENLEAATTLRQVNAELVRLSQEENDRSRAILQLQNKIDAAVRDEDGAKKNLAQALAGAQSLKEVPCGGGGIYATCPLIKTAVEASNTIDDLSNKVDNYRIHLLSLRQESEALPRPEDLGKEKIKDQHDLLNTIVTSTAGRIKTLESETSNLPAAEAASNQIIILKQSLASSIESRDTTKKDYDLLTADISSVEKMRNECSLIEISVPGIENKIFLLEGIVKQAQQAETTIPSLKAEITRIGLELDSIANDCSSLLAEITSLESSKEQYESDKKLWVTTKETTMPALQLEIDALSSEAAAANSESLSIIEAQGKLKEVEARLSVVTYRMACYARVAKSFGPMEIQSFEIDSAGPEVSRLSNELLFNCFGPRFSLRFVTQELKVDGKGYKDEFDVFVDDQKNGRTGSISDLSGGERTIVSEALALGIALYNKEKNGVSWNTLFRDEVSGALDEIYAPQYITMLRAAKEMGHFQKVYFVCHQPRLKQMADSRIQIEGGFANLAP